MSTVRATAAYRKPRIRLFTMKSGRTYGPIAIKSNAAAPKIRTRRASERRRTAPAAMGAVVAAGRLLTRKSLRPEAQDQRSENDDGESAEDRIAVRADQHLRTAEHQARDRETDERHAEDQHQHERVDQPRHPHVRVDTGERRNQRSGECREPGTEREGDEAHQSAVDAESACEVLVHDHRPGLQAEARAVQHQAHDDRERDSHENQHESILRVRDAEQIDCAPHRTLYELYLT